MKLLICYACVMTILVLLREVRSRASSLDFRLAGRGLTGWWGAMSIAASWIWAPAIFVSTRVGFEYGYSGLVWFCLPNMLALVVFAPIAEKVRQRLPEGLSYVEYARSFGPLYWKMQLTLQLFMQIVIFAIQITAGAGLLSAITGEPYGRTAILMALTPLVYTLISGLRASIMTDALQYAVIAFGCIAILYNFPVAELRMSTSGQVFAPLDLHLLLNFGISSTLGLLVAIFADQQQWQRAFASKRGTLVKTFCHAGILHLVVTFVLGTLGVAIARTSFLPTDSDLIGLQFIQAHYPPLFAGVFVAVVLCALISTLDSALCAFASLGDCADSEHRRSLSIDRAMMFLLALSGALLSLLDLSLVTLWLLAGTIRLSSFAPTMASILWPRFTGRSGAAGIVIGLLVGIPVFAYGCVQREPSIRTVGMVLSIVTSTVAVGLTALFPRNDQKHFSPILAIVR